MKTLKELKDFCEKNNVRYEINPLYHTYFSVWTCKDEKLLCGYEMGMNNIAGRKGKSEGQWTWYKTIEPIHEEDEFSNSSVMMFRERYSCVVGRSYKGFDEEFRTEKLIDRRMANN